MKTNQAELRRRPRFLVLIPSLLLCVVLLMTVILFANHASHPALCSELDLTSGTFSLSGGIPVFPRWDGLLPVPQGATLYIYCSLPDIYGDQAILLLNAEKGVDAALLVDDRLVISPTGRFQPGIGFSRDDLPAPEVSPPAGLWTIRYQGNSHLTVAVQFLTVPPTLDNLPRISLSSASTRYQDDLLSINIWAALFAGLFLAGGCTLLFVYLLTLWMGCPDGSILLLALTTLALCIYRLALYSSVVEITAFPGLILLAKNITILPLMWLLWLKLSPGLIRKGIFMIVLVSTGTTMVLLFLQVTNKAHLISQIEEMRSFWLPVSFLILLAGGAASALRHNAWYRSLFPLMGCVLAVAVVISLLFFLITGHIHSPLVPPLLDVITRHTLLPLHVRLMILTIFSCFILTMIRFIHLLMERDRDLQTAELHNRLASEHADALYRTLLETRSVRHEIRSRTETLRALCQEGDLQRIRTYVEQVCEQSQIASSLYSANTLVNALVAPRFQQAQDNGIQINAAIQVPEILAIADLDLSTVLSNLLDNAVAAAVKIPKGQPRELTFRMELDRGRLHIFCRNNYAGNIQLKADGLPASQSGEWHGYGIRLIRQVVQKYDGFLDIQYDNNLFTVRAVMLVPPDSSKK